MPFRPEHSLLRVEVPALHTIDTSSVENLFGMWSLFSKTSHAMEDGKRLENLSWRLWNRETFCCQPERRERLPAHPSTSSIHNKQGAVASDVNMPALSSSLESAASEVLVDDDISSSTQPPHARPELRRHLSTDSRGRPCEKHITSIDLEKIVIGIKETKDLEPIELHMPSPSVKSAEATTASVSTPRDMSTQTLSEATPSQQVQPLKQTRPSQHIEDISPRSSVVAVDVAPSQSTNLESSSSTIATSESPDLQISQTIGSEDSSSTAMSTHSIVRGFIAGGAPSSYRSQTNLAALPTPILKTSPQYHPSRPKKKGAMFTIGTSSGEEESSLESHMYKSSLSESLRRPDRKQTSFSHEVSVGKAAARHSPVFESDDEDEEVSESAIDDDDSSDWEDSDDGVSGPSSVNERELFQRVDSRPDLTSRRSLLTTLMHEPDRAKAMANAAAASRSSPALRRSRASTPNGPSVAASPTTSNNSASPAFQAAADFDNNNNLMPHRSKPIIMTTSNTHPAGQLALSPRTTRRNMLSTELTESLRKNLLWERQHKSTGNLAALKRRHTAHDVKNLRQHQEPAPMLGSHREGPNGRLTNEFFNAGLQDYHAKGW